ncbi:MAG: hypothetical protein ABF654_05975, partial [Gluconobacter potus]|uniref:hypothetical protein n=1 Tax=Gluconobacter potus TaxID=2724927 RepID=UPI0039EA5858
IKNIFRNILRYLHSIFPIPFLFLEMATLPFRKITSRFRHFIENPGGNIAHSPGFSAVYRVPGAT